MQVLGHKNIKNTLIYTQLVKNLNEDEYTCRVAKTPSEVQQLIEAGFEYVCTKDDLLFFPQTQVGCLGLMPKDHESAEGRT